ncbi:MAG: hypothetical protein ABIQ74_05965 [Chitinophagales bacterium]
MSEQPQYIIPSAVKTEDEEIQIGPLWMNIKQMFWYVLKRWYILLIWIILFSAIALVYVWWYGTKYIATTSFTVEGQSASSGLLSSSLSLANSLGLQGSAAKNTIYNNNFFATLIQSRRVVKESLMQEAVVNGKKDLLANHYVDIYHWRNSTFIRKGWNKNPRLKDFYFQPGKPLDQFTPLEDSIMNVIYNNIIDNNLLVTYDASTPFNIATFNTRSREFSMSMMKNMVNKSASYYMDNVFALNKKNLNIADSRADSIGRVLRGLDYRLANLKDLSNNTIRQKGLVDVTSASRSQGLLATQYSAAVNNLELAKVTLLTTAPILQIIDDPVFSTEASFVRWYIALIVAIFLALFLGSLFLIISRSVSLSNEKLQLRSSGEQQLAGATIT